MTPEAAGFCEECWCHVLVLVFKMFCAVGPDLGHGNAIHLEGSGSVFCCLDQDFCPIYQSQPSLCRLNHESGPFTIYKNL